MGWIWFWLIGKDYAENALQGIPPEGYRYIYIAITLWGLSWIVKKIIEKIVDKNIENKEDNKGKDKGDM